MTLFTCTVIKKNHKHLPFSLFSHSLYSSGTWTWTLGAIGHLWVARRVKEQVKDAHSQSDPSRPKDSPEAGAKRELKSPREAIHLLTLKCPLWHLLRPVIPTELNLFHPTSFSLPATTTVGDTLFLFPFLLLFTFLFHPIQMLSFSLLPIHSTK